MNRLLRIADCGLRIFGKKRGLILLEIIIVLTVLGFAIPTVLVAFARIVGLGANVQTTAVATGLAQEKMEGIIKGRRFVDVVSAGPFDLTGQFSTYNYQTVVDYVDSTDFNTQVPGPTDFKRVCVTITRDNMTGFNVTFSTIIANLGY